VAPSVSNKKFLPLFGIGLGDSLEMLNHRGFELDPHLQNAMSIFHWRSNQSITVIFRGSGGPAVQQLRVNFRDDSGQCALPDCLRALGVEDSKDFDPHFWFQTRVVEGASFGCSFSGIILETKDKDRRAFLINDLLDCKPEGWFKLTFFTEGYNRTVWTRMVFEKPDVLTLKEHGIRIDPAAST